MACWGGSEADFDSIKVIKHLFPYACFFSGIATVTFISNNHIKGINRNVQLADIQIIPEVIKAFPTEKINNHSLDGRNIDVCVFLLRMSEVFFWQNSWIKFNIVFKIFSHKFLTVNFIVLIKLQTFWGLKR